MNTRLYGLLAESPIHAGSGQATGFVDLPFQREAATDYPVIPGSSIKGALKDLARAYVAEQDKKTHEPPAEAKERPQTGDAGEEQASKASEHPRIRTVFGKQEYAGELILADARLLLLPVRSMTAQYRWLTCPHVIERACRDLNRAGSSRKYAALVDAMNVPDSGYRSQGSGPLYLEERQFAHAGALPEGLCELVERFIPHATTRSRLATQLTVLSDSDFAWFARHGLAITARNALNAETKTSENLWYEETLPPDSVLYLFMAERRPGALGFVDEMFSTYPYLQAGGNETVGQGWFAVCAVDAIAAGGAS